MDKATRGIRAERVRDLSYQLVSWPSETGSDGEAAFGDRLAGLLGEIAYFRDHPENLVVLDSHGSPPRRNLVALVRGTGRRALALGGHFDTVATDNYQELQHLACQPDALKAALLADLLSRPLSASEARALADLESGDFIPGRGMLDMKSGVAAGIAVLEHFAGDPDRQGNLVLFATPDEERNSQGMRSLRDALPGLMRKWDLDLVGGINLDATSDQGDGSEGRAIYHGTIGKLLPFAMVVGQSSHASYPFEGISAHWIASRIMAAMEANPDLCDRGAGEVSPPPICLEAKDLRGGYEVTTPDRVWLAFNWLFHAQAPSQLYDRFNAVVRQALVGALSAFRAKAAEYADLVGSEGKVAELVGQVLTFAELRKIAVEIGGEGVTQRFAALSAALTGGDNPLAMTRALAEMLIAEARITGPTVVTGLSSLHYPHTHLDLTKPMDRDFAAALDRAQAKTEAGFSTRFKRREYFTGISDMSFFGAAPAELERDIIAGNTPAAMMVDRPPEDALVYPVVNIGPWGREFHQRLERLHAPYAFEVFPQFLAAIIEEVFKGKG